MTWFIESPIFGVLLSLIAFEIGLWINKKTKISFLNPLLVALVLIIVTLKVGQISVEAYNNGGQIISFFLGPATVALAIPLYKNIGLLKANAMPIIVGIGVGTSLGIASIIVMAKAFGLDLELGLSLVPKSITTPIGIEVSKQIGGMPEITVAAIIFTGLTGAIIAESVFKLIKVHDPVAKGIAIGTSSHALGTSKALEIGEVEGSMSGLAIGIAGLLTVIIAPILIALLNYN